MNFDINISVIMSICTMIVSATSAFAIVKVKVARLEEEMKDCNKMVETLKEELNHYREEEHIRIALLESNQDNLAKELAEVKSDTKTIMSIVQEIRDAALKKGAI